MSDQNPSWDNLVEQLSTLPLPLMKQAVLEAIQKSWKPEGIPNAWNAVVTVENPNVSRLAFNLRRSCLGHDLSLSQALTVAKKFPFQFKYLTPHCMEIVRRWASEIGGCVQEKVISIYYPEPPNPFVFGCPGDDDYPASAPSCIPVEFSNMHSYEIILSQIYAQAGLT